MSIKIIPKFSIFERVKVIAPTSQCPYMGDAIIIERVQNWENQWEYFVEIMDYRKGFLVTVWARECNIQSLDSRFVQLLKSSPFFKRGKLDFNGFFPNYKERRSMVDDLPF